MTVIAQIKVERMRRMSIEASRLFCRPNWIGEKRKLKIRFRRNGNATMKGICLWTNIRNTFPNEMAINIYSTVQTGPKSQDGGAHDGLIIVEYQVEV